MSGSCTQSQPLPGLSSPPHLLPLPPSVHLHLSNGRHRHPPPEKDRSHVRPPRPPPLPRPRPPVLDPFRHQGPRQARTQGHQLRALQKQQAQVRQASLPLPSAPRGGPAPVLIRSSADRRSPETARARRASSEVRCPPPLLQSPALQSRSHDLPRRHRRPLLPEPGPVVRALPPRRPPVRRPCPDSPRPRPSDRSAPQPRTLPRSLRRVLKNSPVALPPRVPPRPRTPPLLDRLGTRRPRLRPPLLPLLLRPKPHHRSSKPLPQAGVPLPDFPPHGSAPGARGRSGPGGGFYAGPTSAVSHLSSSVSPALCLQSPVPVRPCSPHPAGCQRHSRCPRLLPLPVVLPRRPRHPPRLRRRPRPPRRAPP